MPKVPFVFASFILIFFCFSFYVTIFCQINYFSLFIKRFMNDNAPILHKPFEKFIHPFFESYLFHNSMQLPN